MKPIKASDLGRLVRRLDMTQREFCEKYNFNETDFSKHKNGKRPVTNIMAARYGLAIHQEQQAQKSR